MVQIKLTLASILVATAIAPAVAQPLGRRDVVLEARTEPVPAPKHVHVHHPNRNHNRHRNHREGKVHNHNRHRHDDQHTVTDGTTQAPPTTQADPNTAAPVTTREYVDELEVRNPPHVPIHAHIHHSRSHHTHREGGPHHNHVHHRHQGQQAVSNAVTDATQPPPTDPAAAGPVATREYVDELEVRNPPHVPTHAHIHRSHTHHTHREGGPHHNHVHHRHQGQQAVSNAVDATQPPPTDPAAAGPVTTREYVDELEVRNPPHVPIHAHVHHSHTHHAHREGGPHHNHVHHRHQGQQALSNAVDATQPPPTDPAAAGPVTTREYVDELEVRNPPHVPIHAHVHHSHTHHTHREGGPHHNHVHHRHQGQQALSNAVDATQPPPTDSTAAGPVATREYLEDLFERDYDDFGFEARDLDLD